MSTTHDFGRGLPASLIVKKGDCRHARILVTLRPVGSDPTGICGFARRGSCRFLQEMRDLLDSICPNRSLLEQPVNYRFGLPSGVVPERPESVAVQKYD